MPREYSPVLVFYLNVSKERVFIVGQLFLSYTYDLMFLFILSILAVRFGRIPKREKQRLLDEMQSYMNSLNESASMDCTTDTDGQSEEPIGGISQVHRNIFVNEEKLVKISNDNINNNNPSSFHQNSMQLQSDYAESQEHLFHSTTSLTQSRCPIANHDIKPESNVIDNSHYNFPQSPSPNQGSAPAQSCPFNHNDYSTQTSCPWRLSPGAKVLVCVYESVWFAIQ